MATLKLEDIIKEVSSQNWKLLSKTYKNLDSELIMECPEQHEITLSLKKWRRGQHCPICEKNPYKEQDIKIIPKKSNIKRYLAIDDATTITGWSIFDGEELIRYGTITMIEFTAIARTSSLKKWLINMIQNWKPDIVCIEDIQLQQLGEKNGDNVEGVTTFKILAQLQGVILNILYEMDINYEVVYPAAWRKCCDIKGKSRNDKKRSAQMKIKEWYDVSVTQDEADAICIGKYISAIDKKNNEMVEWG